MPISSDQNAETPAGDGEAEAVARDLRRQIATVRAHMEAHRETMEAAGLASVRSTEPERTSHG